jgi:hypothetical protein
MSETLTEEAINIATVKIDLPEKPYDIPCHHSVNGCGRSGNDFLRRDSGRTRPRSGRTAR